MVDLMASLGSPVNLRHSCSYELQVLDGWKNSVVYHKGRSQLLYDISQYCTIRLLCLVALVDIKRIVFISIEPSTSLWKDSVTHLLHFIHDYHYR